MADIKANGNGTDSKEFTKAEQGLVGKELAVKYTSDSGDTQYQIGGDRNHRNNNPGNMGCTGYSERHGSIGCDGERAIFPTPSAGDKAHKELLTSDNYNNKTIRKTIEKYAPPNTNDTEKYIAYVTKKTGAKEGDKLGDLKPEQMDKFREAIQNYEGRVPATIKSGSEVDNFTPKDKHKSEGELPDWAKSYLTHLYGDGGGQKSGDHGGVQTAKLWSERAKRFTGKLRMVGLVAISSVKRNPFPRSVIKSAQAPKSRNRLKEGTFV